MKSMQVSLFEEIVNFRTLSMEPGDDREHIPTTEYLGDRESVVLLPYVCGSLLSVQFLHWNPQEPRTLKIVRWIVVHDWTTTIRPLIQSTLFDSDQQVELAKEEHRKRREHIWSTITDRTRVLTDGEPPHTADVFVVTPNDLIDLAVPLECLLEVRNKGERLIDTATSGLVNIGRWSGALGTLGVHVPREEFALYVAEEAPRSGNLEKGRGRPAIPLRDVVNRGTSCKAAPLPKRGSTLRSSSVIVVCHDDAEGRMRQLIDSWNLKNVHAVVLALCSSGPLDVISGPFADGLAVRIRKRLGGEGIVVCTRLPISVQEAIRMVGHLKGPRSQEPIPLATLVTQYMQQQLRGGRDPFAFPWVIL
jgi:hypothetical protein